MSDRDNLDRSLSQVAQRLRSERMLREFGWAALCIAGAWLVYQIARALIAAPALLDRIGMALIIIVVALLGRSAVKLLRKPTIEQAAALADARADLKDELLSAAWFSRHRPSEAAAARDAALVELQLERAGASAGQLDPRQIVPARAPRSLWFALPLAIAALSMAWLAPRWTERAAPRPSEPGQPGVDKLVEARGAAPSNPKAIAEPNKPRAADSQPDGAVAPAGRPRAEEPDWNKAERVAKSLGRSDRAQQLMRAIQARDAKQAAQLIEQIQQEQTNSAKVDRPIRQGTTRDLDGTARESLSALQDLFSQKVTGQGYDALKSSPDSQKPMQPGRSDGVDRQSAPTTADNPNNKPEEDVMATREGRDEGEMSSGGQGEGDNPGGNSNVADGAQGQQVTQSALADGTQPGDADQSKSMSAVPSAPVIGAKTARLAAQLERVRIDSDNDAQSSGKDAEEKLYSATRAQKSAIEYRAAAGQPRYTKEAGVSGERVPLAQRTVVKEYFLNQRQSEK